MKRMDERVGPGVPSSAAARPIALAVISFVVLMLVPPVATAASGADPSNPALDQYVESVPSSHGNHPDGRTGRGSLPPSVRSQIMSEGGADAKALEAVGSSTALGAPGTSSNAGRESDQTSGRGAQAKPEEKSPSLLTAVAAAATQGSSDGTGLLLVGLVLLTAVLGGTALANRRAISR